MLNRFARGETLDRTQEVPPALDDRNAPQRRNELIANMHPHSITFMGTRFQCANCRWPFTHAQSVGQRECNVHGQRYLALIGKWPCCGQHGTDARGCVPADHSLQPGVANQVWALPVWMQLKHQPLRHTILAELGDQEVIRLRSRRDAGTQEEERRYGIWEQKPGNLRLIWTTDLHLVRFISAVSDAPLTVTTLQDVLGASGIINRNMH